ncbi:hypothetical protein Plhal703r1_c14g0068721 [Plasmopara halstedii]
MMTGIRMTKSDWNYFLVTFILSGLRREKLESGCYQGTGNKKGTQEAPPILIYRALHNYKRIYRRNKLVPRISMYSSEVDNTLQYYCGMHPIIFVSLTFHNRCWSWKRGCV